MVVGRLNPRPQLWIIHVKEIEPPFQFLTMESSISSTLEIASPSVDICLQNPKLSTIDVATSTDDLLSNSKYEMETVISDCTTKLEAITPTTPSLDTDDNHKSLLPSASIKPRVILVAPYHQSKQQNMLTSSVTVHSRTDNATKLNKVATAKPITTHTEKNKIRFQREEITEEVAKVIAETIRKNSTLETLYLCNNNLKDDTLHYIIPALIGRSPFSLFISDNQITDVGVKYIAEMLFSTPNTISMLHLDKNHITTEGVKSIVQAILTSSNSSLITLSLCENLLINDECIDSIIELINKNHTLTGIYLTQCNLSADGEKRLHTATTNRKNIRLYT